MKVEEELKKIAKSPYKDSCSGEYAEFYIEDLLALFNEYAKSYARSLVPEEMEYDETFSDDFREGYGYCREEMLRRIEEA